MSPSTRQTAEAFSLSTPLDLKDVHSRCIRSTSLYSATSSGSYLLASETALQGKFGVELLANARYEGVGKEYACTNKELLFKHGEKAQPAAGSFCSLNELAMGKQCWSADGLPSGPSGQIELAFSSMLLWLVTGCCVQPKHMS